MKEKAVMGFIGILTILLITITMVDVLGNAGKGQLPAEDNGQSSSHVLDNENNSTPNTNPDNGDASGENPSDKDDENNTDNNIDKTDSIIDVTGTTLMTRVLTPNGYSRMTVGNGTFAQFIREYQLKENGSKVLLYDGKEKSNQTTAAAVFMLPLEAKNLQQSADSIMRVYAEYYLSIKQYDKICFGYSDGFKAEYVKWIEGNRISVSNSGTKWVKKAEKDESYESFKEYMRMVFAYAGIWTMKDESTSISLGEAQIGDVFFDTKDGGRVAMIVDICQGEDGRKAYLLASGGKPAQEFELLANPLHTDDPWYYEEEIAAQVDTPEFTYKSDSLRRLKY